MTDTRIKRNLHKEVKIVKFWDAAMLLIIAMAVSFLAPAINKVGARNEVAITLVYAGMVWGLMLALEKYKPGISGMWENNVIIILSNLMAFFVLQMGNLIFFQSFMLFVMISVLAAISVLALILVTVLSLLYFGNQKHFRKARLLIIDTKDENFGRLKRIKYGLVNLYDAWYEVVQSDDENYVRNYVEEKYPMFDAVCILDGFSEKQYNIAVKKALELNKELFVVPKMIDIDKCCATLVKFDDILTLYIPEYSLNAVETIIKRILDIAISAVGLVVAAIPMAIIAAAIKLTSKGPVFYKQTRYTKDKREFEIYKFRTMIPDAEKLTGAVFATKDDPRITKIGKFLRALRLDELPQILNILKGDMSIVGPRPERPVFVKQFEKEIENYNYRFRVKAGLTALSHVYGRYSTYIHDRTCYDLYYIANYSIFLDLKIILLTAKTMFLKSAAEGEDEYKIKNAANQQNEVINK